MSKFKIINNKTVDELGTVKKIIYDGDKIKKTYLYNEKNKSNFYTIIKEFKELSEYKLFSKLEKGEKYITYFKYNEKGNLIYERRFNLKAKTSFIKELFCETIKGKLFINKYGKEKTVNFEIKKNKNGENI